MCRLKVKLIETIPNYQTRSSLTMPYCQCLNLILFFLCFDCAICPEQSLLLASNEPLDSGEVLVRDRKLLLVQSPKEASRECQLITFQLYFFKVHSLLLTNKTSSLTWSMCPVSFYIRVTRIWPYTHAHTRNQKPLIITSKLASTFWLYTELCFVTLERN